MFLISFYYFHRFSCNQVVFNLDSILSRISVKWEYQRKAVVASSIINTQEQRARGLGHSCIPRCSLKGLKRKQSLKPHVCSFNFLGNNIYVQRNLNMYLKRKLNIKITSYLGKCCFNSILLLDVQWNILCRHLQSWVGWVTANKQSFTSSLGYFSSLYFESHLIILGFQVLGPTYCVLGPAFPVCLLQIH